MVIHKIIEKIRTVFATKKEETLLEFREKKSDFLKKIESKKHLYEEYLKEERNRRKKTIVMQIESKKIKKIQALESNAVHEVMDSFFEDFLSYLKGLPAEKKEKFVQKIAQISDWKMTSFIKIKCNKAEKFLYEKFFPQAEISVNDEFLGGATFETDRFFVDYRYDFLVQQKKEDLQIVFSPFL